MLTCEIINCVEMLSLSIHSTSVHCMSDKLYMYIDVQRIHVNMQDNSIDLPLMYLCQKANFRLR